MTKKHIIAAVFAVIFLFAAVFFTTATIAVSAAESPTETQETVSEESDGANSETEDGAQDAEQGLVEGFIEELQDKYGDEWQSYYDAIHSEWGSVEEYLLSLVPEDAPDVAKEGWEAFVAWLGEYSPVWGSILAVVLVIIAALFGKGALKKIKEFVAAILDKFTTLFSSVNKQYDVLKAQNDALMKLLGENPKFAEQRDALEKANEEMSKDDV